MSNSQTDTYTIDSKKFGLIKSVLARFSGAKPVEEPKPETEEVVWSKEWCAKEPETAALAIASLQERVSALKSQIKDMERKPRKRKVSLNPKGVLLCKVPSNTYFKVLRTGEIFQTAPQGWRRAYNNVTNKPHTMSGVTRVEILDSKPN